MAAIKTAVRERPIIFGAESIRAILEGRKTQTRRVIQPQFNTSWGQGCPNRQPFVTGDFYSAQKWKDAYAVHVDIPDDNGVWKWLWCPYGKAGDRLWVREAWIVNHQFDDRKPSDITHGTLVYYCPDSESRTRPFWAGRTRNPMFMPRHFSRITLEITAVRVERLQDITDAGAIAEGCEDPSNKYISIAPGFMRELYKGCWDYLNAKRGYSWDCNPWVWVVEFRKL